MHNKKILINPKSNVSKKIRLDIYVCLVYVLIKNFRNNLNVLIILYSHIVLSFFICNHIELLGRVINETIIFQ